MWYFIKVCIKMVTCCSESGVPKVMSTPVVLLPISDSALSCIEFDFRLPFGELERTRKSMQAC